MTKYLQVEMLDKTVWEVPAYVIATDRATYYADKETTKEERDKVHKEEFDYTMSDNDEIIDWASNNMNWADVRQYAKQISDSPEPDFEEGWCNGEKEIVIKK